MVGASVSHYRIVEKLGSGGMGEVYGAEDEHLGRRVAIKFPAERDDDGEFRRRFEHEARVASRLTHPNIARVYDYGEAPGGRPFLVMELVEGTSLRDALRKGRFEPNRAGAVVAGVLRALEAAHQRGLVHRDIKPANVMLSPLGEVKVLDFGLAKQVAPPASESTSPTEAETITAGLTRPGMVFGTPAFMSPEQARGAVVDARSDLFSAGLLLYECLTGVSAFSGSSGREILDLILTTDPVPASVRVPELPKGWERILERALRKDPARRYQTAAEMLADVEALGPARSRSLSRSMAVALVGTRRRTAITAAGAVAVLAAAFLLIRAMGPHPPSAEAAGWYQRGAVALHDGTYYTATRMLQKAVEVDPDYALAHARLAEAANELDDGARAGSEMLLALAKGQAPGGIAGLQIDAIHHLLTRDFAGAAKVYRQMADSASGNEKSAALVDLGRIYEKSSQAGKALDSWREALTGDPQNAAAHLWIGVLLGRRGDPKYAEELDRASTLYQSLSNLEGQAEVLYRRGYALSSTDLAAARVSLEKARDMSRTISSESQEIAATLQLGAVAYQSGDPQDAERIVSDGVERARRAGLNYLAARGMADLGGVQFLKRDYPRAEASFRESLDIARRYRLRRAEARALFGLGNLHQTNGPEDAAIQELTPALAFYREGGFQIEALQCLLVLARAHRDLGHGKEAADSFEQAMAAARQASDPANALIAEQGLASVLLIYGRWPEAVERYRSARQSAEVLKDRNGVVRGLNGQAAALLRLGRFEEAESVIAEASRAVEKASARPNLETVILQRRGELALARRRNAEAAALTRRAFEDKASSAQTGQSLRCTAGVALARSGQPAAGRTLCEPALAVLIPLGDRFATLEARLQLAEILLALGQTALTLDATAKVIEETAALDDRETGWRAWALRAMALRGRGDSDGAKQAAQKASDLFAGLGWDSTTAQSYAARLDIGLWRRVLPGSK